MSGQPEVLQVVILRDGLLVGTEVFFPGSYTLGSDPAADFKLDDPAVNSQHAVLYFQNGKVAVQDLGSAAGIFVNGHKITTCEVRSVDEISCGPFVLKMRVLRQEASLKRNTPPEVAALLDEPPSPHPTPERAPAAAPLESITPAPSSPPLPAAQGIAPDGNPTPTPASPLVTTEPSIRRKHGSVESVLSAPHLGSIQQLPVPSPHQGAIISGQLFDPPEWVRRAAPALSPRRWPRPSKASAIHPDAQGAPTLYLELYWGDTRREVRSFRIDRRKPVIAAASEDAPMPLWGFSLPESRYVLAEPASNGLRLYVPPRSLADTKNGNAFHPVGPSELEADGSRRFIRLTTGAVARLSEGQMTLIAYVAPGLERVVVHPFRRLPWAALCSFALFGSSFLSLALFASPPPETPDFTGKNTAPVAVRLIAPQVKKRQAAKKPKASKTPAKLSAGPATATTANILATLAKLSPGPNSKSLNGYKLSGLVGKAPIADAGLGTLELGVGRRPGVVRAEPAQGSNASGVGAVGAGGAVTRASASSMSVQGRIDREAVAKVVNAHLQDVRGCYERALLRDPALAGQVVLEWTISSGGKVTSSRTKSATLKNNAVEACILQSLEGWQFPPARGGAVVVSYPFLFNSVGY